MNNYDQWKTASPYDDQVDWGDRGVVCPGCECVFIEENGNDGIHVEFWCPDCGHKFKIPIEQLFDDNQERDEKFIDDFEEEDLTL